MDGDVCRGPRLVVPLVLVGPVRRARALAAVRPSLPRSWTHPPSTTPCRPTPSRSPDHHALLLPLGSEFDMPLVWSIDTATRDGCRALTCDPLSLSVTVSSSEELSRARCRSAPSPVAARREVRRRARRLRPGRRRLDHLLATLWPAGPGTNGPVARTSERGASGTGCGPVTIPCRRPRPEAPSDPLRCERPLSADGIGGTRRTARGAAKHKRDGG